MKKVMIRMSADVYQDLRDYTLERGLKIYPFCSKLINDICLTTPLSELYDLSEKYISKIPLELDEEALDIIKRLSAINKTSQAEIITAIVAKGLSQKADDYDF